MDTPRLNFQNIEGESGARGAKWGVKVQARDGWDFAGREVTVPKRDQSFTQVVLGALISKWSYADTKVGVYTIARRP